MKIQNVLLLYTGLSLLIGGTALQAQTPSDDIMMEKRELCFGLVYEMGNWDEYWEGSLLRENANIGTLTRNAIMPMLAYGIIDKLNLLVAAPYVKTHSDGGQLAGVQGMQDLTVALKAVWLDRVMGKGNLSVLTTVGFATPLTNYLSDYQPYSIGLGTNELSGRAIVRYKLDNGLYLRGSLAYLWRGQTEVERDYYYNNGSYYTPWMDVPNAWQAQATVGAWLLDNALRIEANYLNLSSTSGDDIRIYNMPQPTNQVVFSQVGLFAQYYFKKIKGVGVLASYSQLISGKNMGKFSMLGLGATYQFGL